MRRHKLESIDETYPQSYRRQYGKGESSSEDIRMQSCNTVPDPDYGTTIQETKRPNIGSDYFGKDFLGASIAADYDIVPDPDYGTSIKVKQNLSSISTLKHPNDFKSSFYLQNEDSFPSTSSRHKEKVDHSKFEGGPRKSSMKKRSYVDNAKDDPSLPDDVVKLHELSLDTIADCIEQRYKNDLIYTNCGDIVISVNPFKELDICSSNYFSQYTDTHQPGTPHIFAVSAKAYRNVIEENANQVILVSGESGAGKTEATKLLVQHLMYLGGSEYPHLQDRVIEINPLLEAFGNAKTRLNKNSSRFAKFLSLNVNAEGKIESARVKDYMLEKSRVVHQEAGERNFHSFYAFLTGVSDETLESVFIDRSYKFRILGKHLSLSTSEIKHFQTIYNNQQDVFKLIRLTAEEIQDVNVMLSAVLHLGEIEFEEIENDCVIIKNEDAADTVAALLQLDVTEIMRVFLTRSAKMGPDGETLILSKNKKQAENERDATAKALYERMFGWLVRRVNDSLRAEKYKNLPSIGILDICGFEDLPGNSFEQLCINIVNEHLQNFMNKVVIEDESLLFLEEGVELYGVDVDSINNDALIEMFMKPRVGVFALIDEDTKSGLSSDKLLVSKLGDRYGADGIFIPHQTDAPLFFIKHFPGKVKYNAQSFITKNMDDLSDEMVNCLIESQSELIQDLFSVPETLTGSISTANFDFRQSKKPSKKLERQISDRNRSKIISPGRLLSSRNMIGKNPGAWQSRDAASHSTHIKFFRNSLDELKSAMNEANPFFVRCIKPNDKQVPEDFRRDRVKTQLQYNGIKEVARIRTCGYPFRFSKEKFKKTYGKITDEHTGHNIIQKIFITVGANKSQYHVGKSMVFLKELVKNDLDDALSEAKRREEKEKLEKEKLEREKLERETRERETREREKIESERRKKFEDEKKFKRLQENKKETSNFLEAKTKEDSASLYPTSEESTRASSADGRRPGSVNDPEYDKIQSHIGSVQSSSDSESEEESEEETATQETPKEETPQEDKKNEAWDIPQEREEEVERIDVHEQPILMVVKFIVYVLLFVIIFGTFIIEKVSFLLLVSEVDPTKACPDKSKKKFPDMSFGLIVIAMCIPYALGWLITVAKLCFGNFARPSIPTWIWVFVMENLHATGLCLLIFKVLPSLDVIDSALLLNATAIVPAILKITMSSSDFHIEGGPAFHCEPQGATRRVLRVVLDVLAMLVQISVIPLILILDYFKDGSSLDTWRIVEVVASFILISCSHWENFTDGRLFCELGKFNWFKNSVLKIRYELQMGRHYPFLVTFISKIGLTVLLGYLLCENVSYEDAMHSLSKNNPDLTLKHVSGIIALTIAAFVAFYVSFGACMFQMQIISLTIPACLATPAAIGVFYLDYKYDFLKYVTNLGVNCPIHDGHELVHAHWYYFCFGAAWWLSFLIITRHMWRPQVDRTANMARVFLTPIYCGILTAESIMLNRRRNPLRVFKDAKINDIGDIISVHYKLRKIIKAEDDDEDEVKPDNKTKDKNKNADKEKGNKNHSKSEDAVVENPSTPMLYACATMWHETRTEMVQLLKSLYRLDRDQYIRRLANERIKGYDPEFYNFEAHIFFDDAMEPDDNDEQIPNRWVKELVACMDVACSSVHEKPMKVYPPTKMPTPYGGQLIWEMPGENHLFVHMKDIKKIRNRKRWSQVMYMYYLLGYRHIMASKQELLEKLKEVNMNQGNHGLNVSEINYLLGEESALKAQNTFILALDGDTDFSPGSIKILLDRMKDERVGAACGRIHPIGNGPMVWYQTFEYAVGHWLQKSAEHVFGCVLCSPGCFSLFRAAALMDTNVMKKYTTEPTEPGHHLQYDQGEDRWLCTLMLQQGYRIEYAAAADAWTFAPEGFFEFFNQRRRWMPSTIANILDLLGSSTLTTKRNANMSIIYIFYQWMLMLMTILGPGTIIMMIAGAVKLVFNMTLVGAYLFATIPAVAFTFICFWFSSRIQLIIAAILSIVYTFIMMIVLVGTIITATTENIFHPSVIVIVMLVGIFIVAGICHPQEIYCLLHGILYLMTIPSGYLLLVIYSICNLNDVSWGTREVPTKAQRIEMDKKKKEKEELMKNKPKKTFWEKIFNRGGEQIRELTKLVKTLAPEKTSPHKQLGMEIAGHADNADNRVIELLSKIAFNLEQLVKKTGAGSLESAAQLTSIVVNQPDTNSSQQSQASTTKVDDNNTLQPGQKVVKEKRSKAKKSSKDPKPVPKIERDELKNPLWIEDKDLGNGFKIVGNKDELQFWKDFVTKYLLPIRPKPEEKKKIADGLRELRNSASFAFIIVNLLWMSLNFMFQYTNAARFAIEYFLSGKKYTIEESVLGMGFVILLLLLLIIQMIGMLFHRMGTLQHLLAITQIRLWKTNEDNSYNKNRQRNDIMKGIQKLLKLPLNNDAGNVTKPALPATDGNKYGVTFVPKSSRGFFTNEPINKDFHQNMGRTLGHPVIGRVQNTFPDMQDRQLNVITQRYVSGNVHQKLNGSSLLNRTHRPNLPPPRPLSQNAGFTYRELQDANINITRNEHFNQISNLGAMGRSLYQKTKLFNEEMDKMNIYNHRNNVQWNPNDVFQDGPSFSRHRF